LADATKVALVSGVARPVVLRLALIVASHDFFKAIFVLHFYFNAIN